MPGLVALGGWADPQGVAGVTFVARAPHPTCPAAAAATEVVPTRCHLIPAWCHLLFGTRK